MTFNSNYCTLQIDESAMHALVCINAPEGDEVSIITDKHVMDLLSEAGVVYGINAAAISLMTGSIMYGRYVCVAQGKNSKNGRDGYFDYKKSVRDMKKKPLIMEDGTADYKNSTSLAVIGEGELLAEYIPPTDGESGMNIFGEELKPGNRGRELLPLRGRGIIADEDKKKFYAEYSGHIVMDGNALYIDKLYRVNGNLDIEVGNINFEGDVEIGGDVRSGMVIEAKGSVIIHGHVGACRINAGENITIEKGIQGRDTCEISAAGDVACRFVERCRIVAGGSIYADSVLSSSLVAKNKILVVSKTGTVVSSEVYGMTGVTVKDAGNDAGARTLLRAGLPREEYARAQELDRLIRETDEKLRAFGRHLETVDLALRENKDEKTMDTRRQIMRARIVLDASRKEYAEELEKLMSRIDEDRDNSVITITGTIYEGTAVYLGCSPYLVTEAVREVTYKLIAGAVTAVAGD